MSVKNILSIDYNDENGNYNVKMPKGSNLAETMFSIAAMIRCLVRDNVIENKDVAVEMLNKYLSDPQYEEVSEDKNNDRI